MTITWWRTEYPIRRNIKISTAGKFNILAGYPLTVAYNFTTLIGNNKARADFADIEVLYLDNDVWQVVPSYKFLQGEFLYIQFNAVENILDVNNKYYVYMGNPSLVNRPTQVTYTSSDYAIDTSVNGTGLSFTRPLEDWKDGISTVADAKAAFSFYGINARCIVRKGPDRGLMELKVDNSPAINIDTYNPVYMDSIVYTSSGLELSQHDIRLRATGDKSKYSAGTSIQIVKFQYSRFVQGIDQGEEINPGLSSSRIMVGP